MWEIINILEWPWSAQNVFIIINKSSVKKYDLVSAWYNVKTNQCLTAFHLNWRFWKVNVYWPKKLQFWPKHMLKSQSIVFLRLASWHIVRFTMYTLFVILESLSHNGWNPSSQLCGKFHYYIYIINTAIIVILASVSHWMPVLSSTACLCGNKSKKKNDSFVSMSNAHRGLIKLHHTVWQTPLANLANLPQKPSRDKTYSKVTSTTDL